MIVDYVASLCYEDDKHWDAAFAMRVTYRLVPPKRNAGVKRVRSYGPGWMLFDKVLRWSKREDTRNRGYGATVKRYENPIAQKESARFRLFSDTAAADVSKLWLGPRAHLGGTGLRRALQGLRLFTILTSIGFIAETSGDCKNKSRFPDWPGVKKTIWFWYIICFNAKKKKSFKT